MVLFADQQDPKNLQVLHVIVREDGLEYFVNPTSMSVKTVLYSPVRMLEFVLIQMGAISVCVVHTGQDQIVNLMLLSVILIHAGMVESALKDRALHTYVLVYQDTLDWTVKQK